MRRGWCAAAVLVVLLWLLAAAAAPVYVYAQDAPPAVTGEPSPAPAAPTPEAPRAQIDMGALGNTVRAAIGEALGQWVEQWLADAGPMLVTRAVLHGLGILGQTLLGGLSDSAAAQGNDMLTRLNPALTLEDPTVRQVQDTARVVYNGLVGAGLVAVGFLVLMSFGSVRGGEVALLLPRLAAGAILVNGATDILAFLTRLANESGQFLSGGAAGSSLSRLAAHDAPPQEAGGALLVVAVMAALLLVQRIVMHGVLDVLAMTAPLALAAWVIPWWTQWFWRWASLLCALLVGSVLQTLLLTAGASMVGRAIAATEEGDAQRFIAGAVAVGVLLLTMAAPAMVGLGMVGGSLAGLTRRLTRAVPMRPKRRAPLPGAPAPETQQDAGLEEQVHEVPPRSAPPQRGGQPHTIIYTTLPSLPPSGAPTERPALPPPDYLKE